MFTKIIVILYVVFVTVIGMNNNLLLQLHDFPGPNPTDQALAQGATHNKSLQRMGQRTQPQ